MKRIIPISLLLIFVGGCRNETSVEKDVNKPKSDTNTTTASAAPGDYIKVGSPLPAFKGELLDGGTFDFADLKGKPALLNLWATWCSPCRVEIPELKAIDQENRNRGLQVIGITIDAEGSREQVEEFVEENGIRYRTILDPQGKFASKFEASVIPISVLVGRNGKVQWIHYGLLERNNREFQRELQKALG